MNSAAIVRLIREHELRVFTSGDFQTLSAMEPDAATHALRRLAAQGLLARLKKGVWVSRLGSAVNPYEAVAHLRSPWPTYVSLYSALADYGVVEEIPQVVYAVSSALPKRYRTPIGSFHIHHLPARLIWGFESRASGEGRYPIAQREKAFLDLAYLALTPRSPLELPHKRRRRWELDEATVRRLAKRFAYPPLTAWLESQGFRSAAGR